MSQPIALNLAAVVAAVTNGQPRVLTVPTSEGDGPAGIPSGPLSDAHKTLERSLRHWIQDQAGIEVGYVEQLYTFADRGRGVISGSRNVAVGYLALVREATPDEAVWLDWYDLLPWEDHRAGPPAALTDEVVPALVAWAGGHPNRESRIVTVFGSTEATFDGIRALDRYELLYEAQLVAEYFRDRNLRVPNNLPSSVSMAADHRRIVATALGHLRSKVTYRPVVFELLDSEFTLLELRVTIEALAGVPLREQDFRQLVESAQLVEDTGKRSESTGERPTELFRFRPEVIQERPRPSPGVP